MSAEFRDIEWATLDLLMSARKRGINKLNRTEILFAQNSKIPTVLRAKIVMSALLMPKDIIHWHPGEQDFSITEKGAALYNAKFGKVEKDKIVEPVPTEIVDLVICLPGPDYYERRKQ